MSYKSPPAAGIQPAANQTLSTQKVVEGDVVRIQPKITAGA